jgi:hypothetical protein
MDDYQTTLRLMIQQEDNLRDQRLGWLFALNGLLFTAAGLSWASAGSIWLISILAFVGIASSLSTKAALVANDVAAKQLMELVDARYATPPDPPVWGARSSDLRQLRDIRRFAPRAYPWKVFPALLMLAWAMLPFAKALS